MISCFWKLAINLQNSKVCPFPKPQHPGHFALKVKQGPATGPRLTQMPKTAP